MEEQEALYRPGELVSMMLPGNLPHIGFVSDRMNDQGKPLFIHNIGQGTQEEGRLFEFARTERYVFAL